MNWYLSVNFGRKIWIIGFFLVLESWKVVLSSNFWLSAKVVFCKTGLGWKEMISVLGLIHKEIYYFFNSFWADRRAFRWAWCKWTGRSDLGRQLGRLGQAELQAEQASGLGLGSCELGLGWSKRGPAGWASGLLSFKNINSSFISLLLLFLFLFFISKKCQLSYKLNYNYILDKTLNI